MDQELRLQSEASLVGRRVGKGLCNSRNPPGCVSAYSTKIRLKATQVITVFV